MLKWRVTLPVCLNATRSNLLSMLDFDTAGQIGQGSQLQRMGNIHLLFRPGRDLAITNPSVVCLKITRILLYDSIFLRSSVYFLLMFALEIFF